MDTRRTLFAVAAFVAVVAACSSGDATPAPVTAPTLTTVPPIGTGVVPTPPPPATAAPSPTPTPPSPPPSQDPKPLPVERFIPNLPLEDGVLSLDVVFVDGSTSHLRWPATLDLVSGGLIPYGWGFIAGGSSRDFFVRPGSVEDVLSLLGGAELLGEYPDGLGSTVGLWRPVEDDVDYLGFEFDDWAVLVYDYRNALQMSEEHRGLWASGLSGTTSEEGFLVLSAAHPLQLAYVGNYPTPPQMTMRGAEGQVTLTPGACEPGVTNAVDEDAFTTWCVESADMMIEAFGSRDFQQAALDGIEVRSVVIAEPPPLPEEEEDE